MKKIVIATDLWYPEVNGVVRVVENIARILEQRDFKVTIIHPGLFFTIPYLLYPGLRISLFTNRKVKKIMEAEPPDYIHLATEGPIGFAVRSYCINNRLQFTTSYQGNVPYYAEYYAKKKIEFVFKSLYAYFRWFHQKSSALMVAVESLKQELEEQQFKNLVVCPLGVDAEYFKQNLNSTVLQDHGINPPIFMYFGRVAKEKNVEEFLQCDLPGVKVIIGDGPLKKPLEKKYPNAMFVGWKNNHELIDWLSVADVFVFPSITETFGLVITEALACGIPVAAHNVMGPKDIITPGVDGFLSDNLAEAAVKCLNLSKEACRQKALQFTWEKSVDYFTNYLVPAKTP